VRARGHVLTAASQVPPGTPLTIEFHDGTVVAKSEGEAKARTRKTDPVDQGKLLGIALAALLLLGGAAQAKTLTLDGTVTQGGLIEGQVDPGASVTLGGKKLRVAPDGRFIFGFGRDAAAKASLDIAYADGTHAHRDLTVVPRQWDIRHIDGLPEEQVSPDAKTMERIRREAAAINAALVADSSARAFEKRLIWPVTGTISGIYGSQSVLNGAPRAPHYGVDIAAPAGTPIKAAASGTVTLAERDLYFTGGTVIIDHGYGLSTTYVHLATLAMKRGDKVAQGQVIGTLGATGRATGPNLHWGVGWYEVRLDPELVAGKMPAQ
jgi:murein DD-endopeptidase MepM/ murein hydrolase activator NlpD